MRQDIAHSSRQIEPFQGEPQLLDARLKYIVPPLVEAVLEYLGLDSGRKPSQHLALDTAACALLYTLCKVRGYKVIVGFFNNEARFLELILSAVERTLKAEEDATSAWQVSYVFLLWLSHLLLTPFDLSSVSNAAATMTATKRLALPDALPPIPLRCLTVGLLCLSSSTKAQDAAAAMLVRLAVRPDMQKHMVGGWLVNNSLGAVTRDVDPSEGVIIYDQLGSLKILCGIASSADLSDLIPGTWQACEKVANESGSRVSSNAIAKKLLVKTMRNIAVLSLRSAKQDGPLTNFLQTSGVVEEAIDYMLMALADRDTPVRYAAAKALSLLVQELDPEMGHEVIQAVLNSFREDLPRDGTALDFRAADPLKWHGLTLTLGYALFKRTASPGQLPEILAALTAALQFEQRRATGGSLGTNVRDAANFGIWSLSRRYTTSELLAVPRDDHKVSVIQTTAVQLILSACLDPAGNIRRGSSAALQELVGRHPNQVIEGISLVQIVDYQAVGLRRRAMVDVARKAAELDTSYWTQLIDGVLGWRGIRSADIPSRDAAAAALASLSWLFEDSGEQTVAAAIMQQLSRTSPGDAETLHGLLLALSQVIQDGRLLKYSRDNLMAITEHLDGFLGSFSSRVIRSLLPAAVSKLTTALCHEALTVENESIIPFDDLESLTEMLLARQEDSTVESIPELVKTLRALKRNNGRPLGCIGASVLAKKIQADCAKSTLGGAGRVIALGTLAHWYNADDEAAGLLGEKAATAVKTLCRVAAAPSVDWRVIGQRALYLCIRNTETEGVDPELAEMILSAVHAGLNDYTIDERGDIGSLVRLQAIDCAQAAYINTAGMHTGAAELEILWDDILRLGLEKLDRARFKAAKSGAIIRARGNINALQKFDDHTAVSSYEYFWSSLLPVRDPTTSEGTMRAIIEGCVSCGGIASEYLLQTSRAALADSLDSVSDDRLFAFMSILTSTLRAAAVDNLQNAHAILELLAFLLATGIPQRLAAPAVGFKWRNLLSAVMKSHYKSPDVSKIATAVKVYAGLWEVPEIRAEVEKKLKSMQVAPFPMVKRAVEERLFFLHESDERPCNPAQ